MDRSDDRVERVGCGRVIGYTINTTTIQHTPSQIHSPTKSKYTNQIKAKNATNTTIPIKRSQSRQKNQNTKITAKKKKKKRDLSEAKEIWWCGA